jgi:hypothetical protein
VEGWRWGHAPAPAGRLGSHPCSLPIRRLGKGSGGPTLTVEVVPSRAAGVGPSGTAMGVAPAVEVAPAPSGAAMGAAPAVGVGPSGAAIGARPTTGVVPSRAAWSVGKSNSSGSVGKTTLGGSMAALTAQELIRGCFGLDPITYGEEKRFKDISVSLDGKNDLE